MNDYTPIVSFSAIFAFVWLIAAYNRFIKYRNMIEEGWSIMDVALKRRASLVPRLISAVRGYMANEAGTLESITAHASMPARTLIATRQAAVYSYSKKTNKHGRKF